MFSTIFTIAAVHLIALMSPGPDCFIVMQTAVGRSRKEALCCVLGITLGVAFWAALSLLGLQWLFERFAWLQQVIMLLGGLYLGWLAYLLLKSAFKKGTAPQAEVQTAGSGMIYAVVVLESLLWFSFVALILGMPKPKTFYRKSGKWIDGICGAIFGAFGVALVWTAVKEATH